MSFSGWKGPRRITTLWKDIGRLLCASCNFYRPIMLCKWTYIVISKLCDCKGIKSVHLKRNLSWIFIGWTDAEAEAPTLWPPDVKNWLIGKKTWCWKRLKACGEGDDREWDGWMASLTQWVWVWASSQSWWWTGSLACCSPWSQKELDTTEWLNWTEALWMFCICMFSNDVIFYNPS